ncbi:hypothetical protein ABZ532_19775 [Streptomyces sp. NPDC019396]|uniref:hypothetical protein n=1 Tax=Streptomyces sp. NPDC019396 TaxID=3154687 RepID=UPI0033ECC9B9
MKKLTWAARSLAAVSGALLAGGVLAPSAMASTDTPSDGMAASIMAVSGYDWGYGGRGCNSEHDVASATVDDSESELFGTVFTATTDRRGEGFLNDSRDPADWFSLSLIPGAPDCVQDVALSVTEADPDPGTLYITVVDHKGVVYQAECSVSGTILDATNIAAACGAGFIENVGTPV